MPTTILWDGFCIHCGTCCYHKCDSSKLAKTMRNDHIEDDPIPIMTPVSDRIESLESKILQMQSHIYDLESTIFSLRCDLDHLENKVRLTQHSLTTHH